MPQILYVGTHNRSEVVGGMQLTAHPDEDGALPAQKQTEGAYPTKPLLLLLLGCEAA